MPDVPVVLSLEELRRRLANADLTVLVSEREEPEFGEGDDGEEKNDG